MQTFNLPDDVLEAEAIFKAVDWIIKDIKNETLS